MFIRWEYHIFFWENILFSLFCKLLWSFKLIWMLRHPNLKKWILVKTEAGWHDNFSELLFKVLFPDHRCLIFVAYLHRLGNLWNTMRVGCSVKAWVVDKLKTWVGLFTLFVFYSINQKMIIFRKLWFLCLQILFLHFNTLLFSITYNPGSKIIW